MEERRLVAMEERRLAAMEVRRQGEKDSPWVPGKERAPGDGQFLQLEWDSQGFLSLIGPRLGRRPSS